jgi:hypothetical protein
MKNYSLVREVQTRGKDFPVLTPLKKNYVQGLCVHVLAHPIANSTYSHGIFELLGNKNLPEQVLCSYKWLSLFLLESKLLLRL